MRERGLKMGPRLVDAHGAGALHVIGGEPGAFGVRVGACGKGGVALGVSGARISSCHARYWVRSCTYPTRRRADCLDRRRARAAAWEHRGVPSFHGQYFVVARR